jgi:3-dehydroquinate dehydratase-2
MSSVLVINGPNLELLGNRESSLYGSMTLDDINAELVSCGLKWGLSVHTFQSNHEGENVGAIQNAPAAGYGAIIINPAAFTHTSISVRDALLAAGLPFFEVHISNIHAREHFRRESLISDIASGVVIGFGPAGYRLALMGARDQLAASVKTSGEEIN